MIEEHHGFSPQMGKGSYIHNAAIVIGHVKTGKMCSIWPSAVLRADFNSITIGDCTNIQDNATVHVSIENPTMIGSNVTVGHNAVVHGCTIGDNCLISMGAILLSGCVIGKNCIIGAGAVVTENKIIPESSLVLGVPGKVTRQLTEMDIEKIRKNSQDYVSIIEKY